MEPGLRANSARQARNVDQEEIQTLMSESPRTGKTGVEASPRETGPRGGGNPFGERDKQGIG